MTDTGAHHEVLSGFLGLIFSTYRRRKRLWETSVSLRADVFEMSEGVTGSCMLTGGDTRGNPFVWFKVALAKIN